MVAGLTCCCLILQKRFKEEQREKYNRILEDYLEQLKTLVARQQVLSSQQHLGASGEFERSSLRDSRTKPQDLVNRYKELKELKALSKKVDRIRKLPVWPGRGDMILQIDRLQDQVEWEV